MAGNAKAVEKVVTFLDVSEEWASLAVRQTNATEDDFEKATDFILSKFAQMDDLVSADKYEKPPSAPPANDLEREPRLLLPIPSDEGGVECLSISAPPVDYRVVPPLPPRSSSPKQTVHQSLPYGGDIQAAMKNQDRAAIREIMKAKKRSADHGNASDAGSKGGAATKTAVVVPFVDLPNVPAAAAAAANDDDESANTSGTGWVCQVCQAENEAWRPCCKLCSTVQPEDTVNTWACGQCSLRNAATRRHCEACGGPAPFTESPATASPLPEDSWWAAAAAPPPPPLPLETPEQRSAREKQERDDRRYSELLSEPRVGCVICSEDYPVSETFCLDCTLDVTNSRADRDHRYCFDCLRRQVTIALKEKKLPACVVCQYRLSEREIRQLFPNSKGGPSSNSSEVDTFLEVQICDAMGAAQDRYIGCPRPNCPQYVEATTPGMAERCVCPSCGPRFAYCSLCKEKYHGKSLSCEDAKTVERSWVQWLTTDRDKYMKRAGLEQRRRAEATEKFTKATQDAARRLEEEEQDEAWKESHCKTCPHCGKVVYKVDGCDSMTCGRDASDKGGGNKQDGCGKAFRWNQAPAYKRPDQLASQNIGPQRIEDVDANVVKQVRHHIQYAAASSSGSGSSGYSPPGEGEGGAPGLARAFSEEYRLKCFVCFEDIVGPRLVCIHCPGGPDFCIQCAEPAAALEKLVPNDAIVRQLIDMGCSPGGAALATHMTRNAGVEQAFAHYDHHDNNEYQFLLNREEALRDTIAGTHAAEHAMQIFYEDQGGSGGKSPSAAQVIDSAGEGEPPGFEDDNYPFGATGGGSDRNRSDRCAQS